MHFRHQWLTHARVQGKRRNDGEKDKAGEASHAASGAGDEEGPQAPSGEMTNTPGGDGVFGGHRSSWWGQPQVASPAFLNNKPWASLLFALFSSSTALDQWARLQRSEGLWDAMRCGSAWRPRAVLQVERVATINACLEPVSSKAVLLGFEMPMLCVLELHTSSGR